LPLMDRIVAIVEHRGAERDQAFAERETEITILQSIASIQAVPAAPLLHQPRRSLAPPPPPPPTENRPHSLLERRWDASQQTYSEKACTPKAAPPPKGAHRQSRSRGRSEGRSRSSRSRGRSRGRRAKQRSRSTDRKGRRVRVERESRRRGPSNRGRESAMVREAAKKREAPRCADIAQPAAKRRPEVKGNIAQQQRADMLALQKRLPPKKKPEPKGTVGRELKQKLGECCDQAPGSSAGAPGAAAAAPAQAAHHVNLERSSSSSSGSSSTSKQKPP
jgi:hypothetical protein